MIQTVNTYRIRARPKFRLLILKKSILSQREKNVIRRDKM